eukprot:UN08299
MNLEWMFEIFHSHSASETKVTCYTAENVECFQSLIEKNVS